MKIEIINITPELARHFLKRNTSNRPIRRVCVNDLKTAFLRGEYITTHQGIAFAEDGSLIDGQHRLTAISELDSGEYSMAVSYGVNKDAFSVIDTGTKRTVSDSLGEDARLVAVANLIAKICNTKTRLTSAQLLPYIDNIRDDFSDIMKSHGGAVRHWSSSPVILSAIMAKRSGGDWQYILNLYKNMVARNIDELPPVAKAIVKMELLGKIDVRNLSDTMSRCSILFDKRKSNITRIQISDGIEINVAIRHVFSNIK